MHKKICAPCTQPYLKLHFNFAIVEEKSWTLWQNRKVRINNPFPFAQSQLFQNSWWLSLFFFLPLSSAVSVHWFTESFVAKKLPRKRMKWANRIERALDYQEKKWKERSKVAFKACWLHSLAHLQRGMKIQPILRDLIRFHSPHSGAFAYVRA